MALAIGNHNLGPDNASLRVRTYREGMAAKVGHDLVFDVSRWKAKVGIARDAGSAVELTADSRSLKVREGVHGIKPLTDGDRREIEKNIDNKVLREQPISFHSSVVRLPSGSGRIFVEGDLTIAGLTRPVQGQLSITEDGHFTGAIRLTQSEWGIKPYSGLMGALRVRDDVEVVIEARLPAE